MKPTAAVDEFGNWPTVLADIARIIGREAALRLASHFGGLDHVRIPRRPTRTHLWCGVLTEAEWTKIVAAFGGEYLNLPRGKFTELAKAEIIHLAETGEYNHRQIALRCHVTERYVRRVLAADPELAVRSKVDPRQMGLFQK